MSVEANKAVVRRAWQYAAAGELHALASVLHDDVTHHGPGGQCITGRDAVIAARSHCFDAFPGLSLELEDIFGEGDRVLSRVRLEGRNTRAFMGIPATGNDVVLRWLMSVARLDAGKVVEEWEVFDRMDFFAQLGGPEPATHTQPQGVLP